MEMEWEKLLSPARLGMEDTSPVGYQQGRTQFHKDCDRIVFSSSFRRLGKKTQVHPLAANDHVHTRLTHSLEVASVGRSLGFIVGENIIESLPDGISPSNLGQIMQAACLAHDIGNPPFGHAGEEAIKSWFSQYSASDEIFSSLETNQVNDLMHYDGNPQGFRVISQLEYYQYDGGMRLTYATLGAMVKYPWTSREITRKPKFGCFNSEEKIFEKIAKHLGLIESYELKWCRHPLAFLVEAADDICYTILDLEDAHEMKILLLEEVSQIFSSICSQDPAIASTLNSTSLSPRRKMAYLRAKIIGLVISEIATSYSKQLPEILAGRFEGDIIASCDPQVVTAINSAKTLAREKVFKHPRKIELEIGSYTTLGILLGTFCRAVREQVNGRKPSFRSERILSMMGLNAPNAGDSLYNSYLKVLDYISGMTDSYATHMAKQIGGMAQ